MTILEVQNLKKTYTTRFGGAQVEALKNVTFSVEEGEYVAIMGESGSGKTTLLNILAALDKPTGGHVKLKGRELSSVPEKEIVSEDRIWDLCSRILISWIPFPSGIIFSFHLCLRGKSTQRWKSD